MHGQQNVDVSTAQCIRTVHWNLVAIKQVCFNLTFQKSCAIDVYIYMAVYMHVIYHS